jgi:uncharacterized protein YjbI with pentapeptide repeats
MANEEHVALLKQGVDAWNKWRREHADTRPDLGEADLGAMDLRGADLSDANLAAAQFSAAHLHEADLGRANLGYANLNVANLSYANLGYANLHRATLIGTDLRGANLHRATLSVANLSDADLHEADLGRADLSEANLARADLGGADLSGADLRDANLARANLGYANLSGADLHDANLSRATLLEANLIGAILTEVDLKWADLKGANLSDAHLSGVDLTWADLTGANLSEADLTGASLVETHLENADLNGCRIYGISAWNLRVNKETKQSDLIITPLRESNTIKIDDLEVAQFIYLLLNNQKIRQVIDTITSKVVLILGRFTEERKPVLDAIRGELRKHDYIPVLFDFDKPTTKDLHETITTLARMSRFVVADITDAKSIPQELVSIVEQLPSLPVQPILKKGHKPWAMFDHIKRYPWVLKLYRYATLDEFIPRLRERVISPAEIKVMEIREKS